MYVVVTRYEGPKRKRTITHAYTEGEMTKEQGVKLKRRIIRDHRSLYPDDKGTLTVNVLKVLNIEMLNKNFEVVYTDAVNERNRPAELQGPHQGPSGEVLI